MQVIVRVEIILDPSQVVRCDLAVYLLRQFQNFVHGQLIVAVFVGLVEALVDVVARLLVEWCVVFVFALLLFFVHGNV